MTKAKVVSFSCVHAPYQHGEAIEWLKDELSREKGVTHLVLHGDLFESAAASVHPDEHSHDQEDEYREAARVLTEIRKSVPNSGVELVWCLGNHDDNLQRRDKRRVPKELRSLVHWNKSEWGSEFRRWRQVPYTNGVEGIFQLGNVIWSHGWSSEANSDEMESIQLNYQLGGWPNQLYLRGHTHRPVDVTQAMRSRNNPLRIWYGNVGHMGQDKPGYMQRQSTVMWGHAYSLVECDPRAKLGTANSWSAEIRRYPDAQSVQTPSPSRSRRRSTPTGAKAGPIRLRSLRRD